MKPLQENALRLALYQPDIPANTGAMMRLCACMGMAMDIIEPCGFPFDDRKLKRTVMDYAKHVDYKRHLSWAHFKEQLGTRRLVLLTTKTDIPYYDFEFRPDDVLMVGRESAGVPDDIHNSVDARITIPMAEGVRSLNVGMAAAIVVSEALRQIKITTA
jgi:tRNA (cytidine/uridine-2'-O-)-methyltransferase